MDQDRAVNQNVTFTRKRYRDDNERRNERRGAQQAGRSVYSRNGIRLFSSRRQTLARSNAFVSYAGNPFEEITTKNVENVVGGVRLSRK